MATTTSSNSDAEGVLASLLGKFKGAHAGMAINMVEEHDVITSGVPALDYALGTRGLVATKMYELFGEASSGKSLVAYNMIAAQQQAGKVAALYDAERSSDTKVVHKWMDAQDVDIKSLVYMRQESGERACDMMLELASDERVGIIVIDSIAWMSLGTELAKRMDEKSMQSMANLLPEYFRKHTHVAKKSCLVLVNQVRDNVGGGKYAAVYRTGGGQALKFGCAARIHVKSKRIQAEKGKKKFDVGIQCGFTIVKNKLASPRKSNYFNLYWKDTDKNEQGVDHYDQIMRLGLMTGAVDQSGAWMVFKSSNGDVRGQGAGNFCLDLRQKPQAFMELARRVMDLRDDSMDVEGSDDDDAE